MSFWQSAMSWLGLAPGSQDGDNFRTNTISLERAQDSGAANQVSALGLSSTWACVNFLAGLVASLPIVIYRKGPLGVPVEDRTHPLFWILHDSPNYDQSAYDFWEFMCAGLELHGNAYAIMERRADGFLVSLTPVRPDLVVVRRLSSGEIEYRWAENGVQSVYLQDVILHIRGFGGGPLGGISPLAACRNVFGAAVSTDRTAGAMFANGARPSGVLSTTQTLTGEQRQIAEGLLQSKFTGAINTGRPMLLDNGLKWEQLSISPEDAQMLETRKFGVEEICRVFDVPPHLIGHTEGNTQLGSSIGEQTQAFLNFKLRKRLKRIEGALEKQLLTRAERDSGVSIEFNVEGFLRTDSQGRAKYYDIMKQFMTKNEIRAIEGLAPVDGGDVMFAQMQDIPLADAIDGQTEKAA